MGEEAGAYQPLQQTLDGWHEEGGQLTDLLVPAEFNHEMFPMASTALHPTEELLTFTLETVLPDGRLVERTLEVEGSPRLGLPGLFDQEVYAGIMALVGHKGGMPEDGVLRFSFYELKEILALPTNAENYRRLRESLLRWQRTSLTTQGAVYLADTEEYAHGQAYNIWSIQWARDSRPGRAKTELNEVRFHDYFIRNYQAGYIKSIDWDFWLTLGRGKRGGTLKRLYRLIDVQRASTLEWHTTVQRLMGQVPIPPSYKYPGKARDYLRRLHPELVERGFLESAEISKDYEVSYKVDPRFVSRQKHLELADDPRDRSAIERLISFRVRESAARHLVSLRGANLCHRYMDALAHQKNVGNKAGWLNTYLLGNTNGPYPPKYGFSPQSGEEVINPAKPLTALPDSNTHNTAKSDLRHDSPSVDESTSNFYSSVSPLVDRLDSFRGSEEDPDQKLPVAVREVRSRVAAGGYSDAVEAFETVPHGEYVKMRDAAFPVVHESGDRFYVSPENDLYVYAGDASSQNLVFVKNLDRSC